MFLFFFLIRYYTNEGKAGELQQKLSSWIYIPSIN